MAKKNEETVQEAQVPENKPEIAENKPKTVKIKLPLTRTEKDDVYVGLNGEGYLIKRGEVVEVPVGVAEILQHKEEMLSVAMKYEDSFASK